MPAIFEFEHIVRSDEIDALGHVNNLVYLRWMQEAAIGHSAAQGWPAERYREIGASWVVRSHFIEYRQPAFASQSILVLTWVASFKRISSLRKYKIIRKVDATLLAVAETNWAFIGVEHHVPRRVPNELVDSFVVVPVEHEP